MAAQGNETTYKRAEGETTQWEDIQGKLGNLPKKEKPEKNKPFEPEIERDGVTNLIEAENIDELENLEDEFAEDPFLEQYRELRLKELKEKASTSAPGLVQRIVREQFVREVTDASEHCPVIVHLFKDKVPDSAQMAEVMETLASSYKSTKFVKILSTDCIPGYPDTGLPLVLVYKAKKALHNLQGLQPYGDRVTPEHVADVLTKLGAISKEPQNSELNA